jgi:hypothetical protein
VEQRWRAVARRTFFAVGEEGLAADERGLHQEVLSAFTGVHRRR